MFVRRMGTLNLMSSVQRVLCSVLNKNPSQQALLDFLSGPVNATLLYTASL